MTRLEKLSLVVALSAVGLLAAGPLAGQCPGVPTFTPPLAYSPAGGGEVLSIAHADLDGDGDLDLVLCNGAQIVVMRNNGVASFTAEPAIPAPCPLVGLTVGDFDGDGMPDVAATGTLVTVIGGSTTLQGRVVVFLNHPIPGAPGITFAAPVSYPFGPQVMGGSVGRAIRAGDLNADGILDLVAVDSNSTNVWVLLGQGAFGIGNGTFGPPGSFPVFATNHQDVAIADLNQDGAPDLALVQYGGSTFPTFATLLAGVVGPGGLPTGAFVPAGTATIPGTSAATSIEAADLNNDGFMDLAIADYSTVVVEYGGGGFAFVPTAYPAGAYPNQLAIGDFSGDGFVDIAVARNSTVNSGGNFSVLVGQPGGGFVGYNTLAVNGGFPVCLTAADLNGDGRLDIAVGRQTGGVDVITGTCPASLISQGVAVTYPNGGETLGVGGSAPIVWSKTPSVAVVDLDVSRDGGLTWAPIARTLTGTTWPWLVTPPGSAHALIRVSASGRVSIADPSNATFTIAGPGAATAISIGSGCSPYPTVPALTTGVPVLGSSIPITVFGAIGLQPGALFVSFVPAAPSIVGPGCTAYLDLSSLTLVTPFTTTGTGTWNQNVPIPNASALTGLMVRLQAATGAPAAPGYALTNAIGLTLGW